MRDTIITAERYTTAREKTDEKWSDWDVFSEERDSYPLRKLVLEAVEGEFTHPQGDHTIMTLMDSIDGITTDYVSDAIPDVVPDTVTTKFQRNLQEEVSSSAETLYNKTKDEAESLDSIRELQTLLETEAEQLGIPRKQ